MELFCLFVIASIILKCISTNIAFAVKKMCIGFHKIVSLDRVYQLQLPRMSDTSWPILQKLLKQIRGHISIRIFRIDDKLRLSEMIQV